MNALELVNVILLGKERLPWKIWVDSDAVSSQGGPGLLVPSSWGGSGGFLADAEEQAYDTSISVSSLGDLREPSHRVCGDSLGLYQEIDPGCHPSPNPGRFCDLGHLFLSL
jgi:hypothetical protein